MTRSPSSGRRRPISPNSAGRRTPPLLLLAANGIGTWIVDVNRFYDEAESGELVFEGMDPPGGQG